MKSVLNWGEIEGFLDTVTFDHLIIGGDFSVDFSDPRLLGLLVNIDFLRDKDLICIEQRSTLLS